MYATTICDNFFAQPDDILSFAQSLEYYPSETGVYPGARSSPLHEINPALFNYLLRNYLHYCIAIHPTSGC